MDECIRCELPRRVRFGRAHRAGPFAPGERSHRRSDSMKEESDMVLFFTYRQDSVEVKT